MISSKIIAHSKAHNSGIEIITFELVYPRFIHSELMTHRVFSRNAASSRAIPIEKTIEMVINSPAMPVEWGANKPGMQATELLTGLELEYARSAWYEAARRAVISANELRALGLHKQIVNRVLEPFVWMKTVVTSTEWDNFFWLRDHKDAQPEFRALAQEMFKALSESTPSTLKSGEWHLPYYSEGVWKSGDYVRPLTLDAVDTKGNTLKEAQQISASCCAQVSYRKLDASEEKAEALCKRLLGDGEGPVHASPFEHQATPMCRDKPVKGASWIDVDKGTTHISVNGSYCWSGNFRGWIQHRQLIPGHSK